MREASTKWNEKGWKSFLNWFGLAFDLIDFGIVIPRVMVCTKGKEHHRCCFITCISVINASLQRCDGVRGLGTYFGTDLD